MSPLKHLALQNMPYIFCTLDTSHIEMSPLKHLTLQNMPCIFCTLDTSHIHYSSIHHESVLKVTCVVVPITRQIDVDIRSQIIAFPVVRQ